MEKVITNFCGCDVILQCSMGNKELEMKYIERAEIEIKKIFNKEFAIPSETELRKIVERDLGIKKHWLFGWIKN